MKIIFADTAHPSLKERLEASGFVCSTPEVLNAENAAEVLQGADGIIIRSRIKISEALIDRLPQLKFIARVGAGMESIDVDYAESKGISCLNAPEGNRNAVAEHALGMLLALMNNLNKADREVRQGIRDREGNRGHELSGKTVGLIGFGNTGSTFAKRISGFDVEILAFDKYKTAFGNNYVTESSLETIYNRADIISLHVPLTDETCYLIHAETLKRFRKPIYLINTARGPVVNTADLMDAIDQGRVNGAALDVVEFENPSFENISVWENETYQRLLKSEKVLLTPHVAGWSFESERKLATVIFEKIIKLECVTRGLHQ